MRPIKSFPVKALSRKISAGFLVSILITWLIIPRMLIAQAEPVSTPVETPISYPEVSANVDNIIDNSKNQFDGHTQEQIDDAKVKVKDALIVPSEDNFFVVKFKDEESANRVAQEVAPENTIPARNTSLLGDNVRLIKIDNETDKVNQMTKFNLDDSVEYVETNQIVKKETWTAQDSNTTMKPNDFNNTNNWYDNKTKLGQLYKDQGCPSGPTCGGSSSVIVAILDTGMAFETNTGATYREYLGGSSFSDRTPLNFTPAPELTGISIWTNPSEDYTAGDEDGDHVCDDLHGADMIAFVDNLSLLNPSQWSDNCTAGTSWVEKEGHPNDDDGHGTYVANMIASLVDNGTSSFGSAFKTQIMPVKVLNYTGTGTTVTIAYGIRYAVDKGAKVLNISIAGLTTPSATLEDALTYARDHNVLAVISSGNHGASSSSLEYPAAYTNSYDNVIAVGASTNTDTRASYSNYGTGLDLVAPVGIGGIAGDAAYGQTFNDADSWSSTPVTSRNFTTYANKYWLGTSFAAPQVTSIAAMLLAKSTYIKPSDIKTVLRNTAQDIGASGYDVQTGFGIPNFQAAWASVSANAWDIWITNGGTPGDVVEATFKDRVYQTVRGFNNWYYTRHSFDGKNWTNWDPLGGTPGNGAMFTMKDGLGVDTKLFQAIRGFDNILYTRYTSDGDNWSSYVPNGGTPDDPTLASFKGRIYESVRGMDNHAYTRNSADGNTWTAWVGYGGTPGKIAMASLNDTKLYQSIRGIDNHIYTSVTTDGTNWSVWDENGGSNKDVTFGTYGTRLYSGITGINSLIYTRYIDVGSSTWATPWTQETYTLSDITFDELNGNLFRALRGGDGKMYVSSSADGIGFGPWEQDIAIKNDIAMVTFTLPDTSKVIVQAAVSPGGIVFTRRSQ